MQKLFFDFGSFIVLIFVQKLRKIFN